ncbi:E3 ubiquitin-protein ligase RNF135 isoform X1 [Tiliqua scincoides]|uniref:E3 ubiquitin-protein ligase RNF135 isoform X1 n=1 Tax=Tiliqua scincoides TaxID=71010 RepID=UPI0034628CB7
MAVAEALDPVKNLQDELICCLCLDYFKHPVLIIQCSHNFCKDCISRHCKEIGTKASCPKCRGQFHPNNLVYNRSIVNILETFQLIKKTARTRGWKSEKCQEFLNSFKKDYQEAGGSQDLKFSPAGFLLPYKHKDVVKLSEVSKETELALETLARWTKESIRVKDYVSLSKSSVIENFSFLKKYINDQEETVLKVIDEGYKSAQQKIDAINEQLRARIERLLDLQNNSKELLQTTSSDQEVYVSSPVAMNEVTVDIQKISSILHAVEELKNVLEKSVLETCLGQLLQEPSPGTSKIDETEMDVALDKGISSSNSAWNQDSLQETGSCSSAVASTRNNGVPIVSRQFSQWASNVTFDHKRIHRMLKLSEDKKRVTVSLTSCDYGDSTKRFRTSQVMGSPGFSEGCHYWEASTKDCIAWAIGVADGKIGRDDQLGRTELSWCIEWSNKRLSAWHNNQEIQIEEEKPLQVGVFLDIPRNTLSFYSLTVTETFLHQFKINVVNPVYPAFWIYGGREGGFLTINYI